MRQTEKKIDLTNKRVGKNLRLKQMFISWRQLKAQRYFQFESNFPVVVIVNDVDAIKQPQERI